MTMLDQLQQRARSGWVAALATGAVLLGSVPFYAGAFDRGVSSEDYGRSMPLVFFSPGRGRLGRLAGDGSLALSRYWLISVPIAYLLLAGWFALRARRTGLAQRWSRYIGFALSVFAVLVLSVLPVTDPLPYAVRAISTPLLLLAGSLAVLGVVEHDRRLQVLGGLGAVVATYVGIIAGSHPFVVPDGWPLEPLLSAAASPQGAVCLLGAALLVCGALWRPARS